MIAVFGGRAPVFIVATMAMMLLAGATLGANQAANGEERVDLSERLNDDLFTDDGELKDTEFESPPEQMPIDPLGDASRDLLPETPRIDAVMERHLIVPMVRGSIWVAETGFALGYSMSNTLGVGVTRVILNGGVFAAIGGVMVYTARTVVAASREVGT